MKSLLFLILLVGGLNSHAENEAGIVLGSASGFSGMFDLNGNRAVDVGIAYNSDSSTYLYGDYLFNNARSFALKGSATPMTLYYGLGLRVMTIKGGRRNGDSSIGPRAPIGLHYKIVNPDISFLLGMRAVAHAITKSKMHNRHREKQQQHHWRDQPPADHHRDGKTQITDCKINQPASLECALKNAFADSVIKSTMQHAE